VIPIKEAMKKASTYPTVNTILVAIALAIALA